MIHLLLPVVVGLQTPVENLFVNGDFEAGPKGFITNYRLSDSLYDEGTFAVVSDPRKLHPGGASMRDHTGRGLMLAVNGTHEKGLTVWQQTVKVEPNTVYTFSGWGASWSVDPGMNDARDTSPALLRVFVNGRPSGAVFGVNARSGTWSRFSYDWHSGSQKRVTFRIENVNYDRIGNDFAIDDMSLIVKK
jgi:hypothetical protein